jgi:hypothetical protein
MEIIDLFLCVKIVTIHTPLRENFGTRAESGRRLSRPAGMSLSRLNVSGPRAKLSARLRRVLADHPRARHFTVHRIIEALRIDPAESSLALFSAAGVFAAPKATGLSGPMISAIGAGLALGRQTIALPRRLLRKKIPRNSLSILVQGISALLDATEGATRERWGWVFHPATSVALGLILFLLGVASMAPIIGGGAQHAASAFLMAIGLAERDGLAVMIGALAGIASLALAALSIATGRKLWKKVKAWLVQCARRLHLGVLASLLDRCCNGLGDLVRLKWGGLLLLLLTPAEPLPPRKQSDGSGALRRRARLAFIAGNRSGVTLKAPRA